MWHDHDCGLGLPPYKGGEEGQTLQESAPAPVDCLAQQFPSFIDKNKLCQRKHPELQAHGGLKIDVLWAAFKTLVSLLF